ncbi:unnamed protein product [Macrosiphum euphorbiae]|uniref:Uncharacterized protein n=1 Tax=Macrosiphum euphorbiae TaxID=13131 RepID=A0AAV0W358_9HEMI|nr:unnamed protein product [Macrosiphum euphorbiae]
MEKDMVRELRKIAHESPLNVSVFHPYFVFFDQFELVRPTSIQSMVVGGATMMLISFLFIPNVLCSLWWPSPSCPSSLAWSATWPYGASTWTRYPW